MKAHSIKTDNTNIESKVELRRRAVKGLEEVKVLDLFAGNNVLWSDIKTDRYFGVEREKGKGRNLNADNLKVIPSLDLSQFNVIDLDSYGIPYQQVKALYRNPTLRKGTRIIYTCIGNAMSTMCTECVKDFNLQEFIKKTKTLINRLSITLFFEMLRRHGVEGVTEYEITDNNFTKKYGYFEVKRLDFIAKD